MPHASRQISVCCDVNMRGITATVESHYQPAKTIVSVLTSPNGNSCLWLVLVYREKGDTGAKKKKKKQKKKKDKSGGKDSAQQDPLAKVRKPFSSA